MLYFLQIFFFFLNFKELLMKQKTGKNSDKMT